MKPTNHRAAVRADTAALIAEGRRYVELASRATAGPWTDGGVNYNDHGGKYRAVMAANALDEIVGENGLSEQDAAFIAQAPAMAALIGRLVEALEQSVAPELAGG